MSLNIGFEELSGKTIIAKALTTPPFGYDSIVMLLHSRSDIIKLLEGRLHPDYRVSVGNLGKINKECIYYTAFLDGIVYATKKEENEPEHD